MIFEIDLWIKFFDQKKYINTVRESDFDQKTATEFKICINFNGFQWEVKMCIKGQNQQSLTFHFLLLFYLLFNQIPSHFKIYGDVASIKPRILTCFNKINIFD